MRMLYLLLLAMPVSSGADAPSARPAQKPSLKRELAALKVPPPWLEKVQVHWDTAKPWQDARLEVRRLLAEKGDKAKEGVKLTWLYFKKGDIGDGHELPMYLFLSGNYAWATVEYEKRIQSGKGKEYLNLAACYMHFGEYPKAKAMLERALKDLPEDPWRINALANVHNGLGDLHRDMGDLDKAREHYREAIRLYPTSNQPYGRHVLKRQAAKVQNKLDLLTMQSLATIKLEDGTYKGTSLGFNDQREIVVTLTVKDGKIARMDVDHGEKIELDATVLIPKRIIAKQSLQVDAITGATITSQAIIDAALQAVRQAGAR